LPEIPKIQLIRKEDATAKGIDDFSIFSLKCTVSTAKETNVKYKLQWVINGDVSKTKSFTSTDAKGGQFESVLSGDSLKSFLKIDQVSENQERTMVFNVCFCLCLSILFSSHGK